MTAPLISSRHSPEATSKIGNAETQDSFGQEVGASADQLSLQIPSVYASCSKTYSRTGERSGGCLRGRADGRGVAGPGDDIQVVQMLESIIAVHSQSKNTCKASL
jgi:hypothetical protein